MSLSVVHLSCHHHMAKKQIYRMTMASVILHHHIDMCYGHLEHAYSYAMYLNFISNFKAFYISKSIIITIWYYLFLARVRLTTCCRLHESRPLLSTSTCIECPPHFYFPVQFLPSL